MKRTLFIVAMLVSVMLISCKPEDEEGNNNYGGGDGFDNSGGITGIYTPGKKISKIKSQTSDGYHTTERTYEWSWNGDVLERIIENRVHIYSHDGLGRLTRVDSGGDWGLNYIYENNRLVEMNYSNDIECVRIDRLKYTNNKLSEVEEIYYPDDICTYSIKWNGNNITKIDGIDDWNNELHILFEYDDNPNPFYGLLFFDEDIIWAGQGMGALSENNIKKVVWENPGFEGNYSTTPTIFSYEYDNDGYPVCVTKNLGKNFITTWNIEYLGENDNNIEKPERVVLLENYTGIRCVNSPNANDLAIELKEQYPDNLVVLNIHAGSLSSPQPGNFPDFLTEEGTEWYTRFGFIVNPVGTINRKLNGGNYAFQATEWADAVATVLQEEAQVDMILDIDFNNNSRELDVTVKSKFFTELPDTYNLVVCIVEDSIVGKQLINGVGLVEDYVHRHVFRTTMNGTWGEEINDGFIDLYDEFVKSYRTTLSNVYNADQCYIVAYIANNETKEILQVAQKKIK